MKSILLLIAGMAIGVLSLGQVNYHVSTILPEGTNQFDDGLTMDENGTIYASYWGVWQGAPGTHIYRIRKNGEMDTLAVGFNRPNGIHYSDGKVYVANSRGHNVSRVDTLTGQVEVLISVTNPSNVMKFPGVDSLLIVSYSGRKLYGYSDWYGLNEISNSSKLTGPVGIALSKTGDVYVGNFDDGKILKLNAQNEFDEVADVGGGTGFFAIHGDSLYTTNHVTKQVQVVNLIDSSVSVIAGSGRPIIEDGVNDSASFASPNGIVISPSGDSIYISEYQGKALRLIERMPIDTDTVSTGFLYYERDQFKIFPQPATSTCSIELEENRIILGVKLIDVTGNVINANWSRSESRILLDVSTVSTGNYVIQIETKTGEILSDKLIVKNN